MGFNKKAKRKNFLEKYKPSSEKYRIKMANYANNVRLLLYDWSLLY